MDPDPILTVIFKLLLLLALILINALFAAGEMAVITLNDNKVLRMADDGHKKAKKIAKLIKNPSRFLATIQVGVTLSGFLASASAAQSFAEPLSGFVGSFVPLSEPVVVAVCTFVITALLSYFTLVFGELVPKRIAMQRSEVIAFSMSGFISAINWLMKPFITFLTFSTNLIVRLLGFDPNAAAGNVTEEEIRMLVDVGEETGVIEESQKDMIINIFDFDDRTVDEIMTHRTEISAISSEIPLKEAVALAIEEGYSRIPVFGEDIDDIQGIIYVKDLLQYVGKTVNRTMLVRDIMRTPMFIPEAKRCRELFSQMTARKMQMAIVVDEYGGTAGLITMEDLIESIVGNIQDEYDDEDEEVEQVDETTFTVDGTVDMIEIERILDVELPEGDYDTLAGMIISILGRIPDPGEHPSVVIKDITFTVQDSDERRIETVTVVKNS